MAPIAERLEDALAFATTDRSWIDRLTGATAVIPRRAPWAAVGLSVMATQASAITFIGTTGQAFDDGMGFIQVYLPQPIAMVILCVLFVPFFYRARVFTAYEYLEGRFGPGTRSLASLIFLVSRCAALGIVIQAPAVVLAAMTGLAHNLGMAVCAEGVEDQETFEFLKTIGCDKLQGFLISEAVLPHIVRKAYSAVEAKAEQVA